jgi:hypothetical protein
MFLLSMRVRVGIVVGVPPIGGDVDRALSQRQYGVLMAAGKDHLREEMIGIDAHLVHFEPRHVVA